jgi:endo-1,4-beta-xylanase
MSYQDLWAAPEIAGRIDDGIERNRKSEGVVRITDFAGKPLSGVKVRVRQHDSSFHFGANIFQLGGYPTAELNRRYEEAYCGLFNAATVPFYWRTQEPEQGSPRFGTDSVPITRRPPPDAVVKFCQERGLRMHGHTLVWAFRRWSVPDWLPEDIAVSGPLWEKRIRELGARYGDTIKSWDVLNEARSDYGYPRSQPMPENYERLAFKWAEAHFPADVRFDINETSGFWLTKPNETTGRWDLNNPAYHRLIRSLLDDRARLGWVGLQFHLFTDREQEQVHAGELHPPARLFDALDHYGEFGLPLHVSEITLTSPGNTPAGLEAQAQIARNFYRLWFSHAAVGGISWWNVPDGGAAPGEDRVFPGLLFPDLRPKPAYEALRELLHHEWRTDVTGVTDENGHVKFRGFHGRYVVRTQDGFESTLTLQPGKPGDTLIRL